MDDAVVVGIDSLEGEPGFVAIEAAVQQLLQGREGEVAVIHGLVVDPHLPAHEGLALRGKGRGIGQDVLLVRIGGDHVASTDDVLVLVHELEVDNAVVVGVDSLEGKPGLLTGEAAVQQLGEGVEGELAVIHGLAVDPDLPAHEGLTGGGKGRGIGQVVLLVGIGGDHVAAADDVLVLVHELEVDDTVVVGKDGLEGQPGLILIEVLVVRLHECIERIVGELALIHGGIPKTHLPAHKGLALGGEAGGSRGLKLDAGGGGDDIAAAQGHVLAVHIVHKGHMDGVVHSALTVQADHEGIRDNPLDVVVIQHNGHGGAVHTGVSLRIGVIRRHIGGGIELDVVVITLDAQTVARHRVAAIQQAGGDGLVALGGAVHLQVQQKGLQLGIRGGDSADGDRDNIVINHQVALFRQLITLGDPAGINVGGLHAVGVGSHSHGVAVADRLTGHLVHEADRDVSRDALEDRGDGNEALGPIPDDMLKHIGQSRGRRQYAAVLTVVAPAGEGVAGRGGDALKGVETGFRLGEGFMIEHLTGGLGQISLGGIRNVVVDGDGAVLLDKDRKLIIFGSGRISIILRKHVSRGRGEFAQRHGLLVGGNGHTLGAALHFQAGLLIHKHDGEGQRGGLVDGIDIHGSEGIAVFVCSPVVGIGVSSKGRVVKCVYSALPINLPTGELHTDGGGLISLIDGRPQRRPGRISRGHSTLAEFHNTSAHLGGILENNVDGRDLLRPCSGISLAVGYFFFQRGTPAGEVPAVTVQFSGKAGGKVAEQEVLVFLVCENFLALHAIGVGDGVLGLKHIGGAVALAAVGVIAPDGVNSLYVRDINSGDDKAFSQSIISAVNLVVCLSVVRSGPAHEYNCGSVRGSVMRQAVCPQQVTIDLSQVCIFHAVLTIDFTGGGHIGQFIGLGFGLIMAQKDIDPSVVNHPHIQLVAAYKNRAKFTAAKECSIDLDSLDIVRRHLIVPAVISRHRDLQIADSKPGTIVNPLIGIYALHNADCAVVVGVSLHSVASDQRHTVNICNLANFCVKGIRYFFPYIVVFVMDAGMGSAAGIDLSGINVNVLADNSVFGKLLAGAIVAVQLPADKDIVSAERGGAGHLIGQRGIIRYIDGVVKRPSSRFSADFQIEVYLVAGWLLFALVSQSKGSIFCAGRSASIADLKIAFAKHSPYSFCRGTYSLCKSNSDSPNRI